MSLYRATVKLIRRLRPSPVSFAAAAAVYDPAPLLALQALGPQSSHPPR
jgi:hypothetical protein